MFFRNCLKMRLAATTITTMKFQRRMGLCTRSCANFLFKKNLMLTNSISAGGFMVLGDWIQQEYEFRHKQLPERYDWARMTRMFIVGTALGVGHHYYYMYLDKILPKYDIATVLKKVAGDQFICAPPTIILFFYGMGLLEGKEFKDCTEEIKKKFPNVYLVDWIYWPPVQFINFYFLPSHYRVFYINIATMVYDVYLSLMKHFDQK